MRLIRLHELFDKYGPVIEWDGKCHDCGQQVNVIATANLDGIMIEGGAVYDVSLGDEDLTPTTPAPDDESSQFKLKCPTCHTSGPVLTGYQECSVYSRIVGYYRPVKQWNAGKQSEWAKRRSFDIGR